MDHRVSRLLLALMVSAALPAGCVMAMGGSYQANMAKVVAKPPSFQVAKPVPATLYIVLDPAKIQQMYSLRSERRNINLSISDFRLFVSRDLRDAMKPHFERVEVVGPGDPRPAKPHVVADVKVDNMELKEEAVEGDVRIISTRLFMTWAFGIRPSDADEYLFSFAGVAASTDTSNGAEDFVRQAIESAISGLLEKWGKADVHAKLLAWSRETTAPSARTGTSPPTPAAKEGKDDERDRKTKAR